MNYSYTYHSPLIYQCFEDACTNLSNVGVDVCGAMYAILRGIHHQEYTHFKGVWVCDVSYDFPFEDDPTVEITVESWIDFLLHYYEVMYRVVCLFVQQLPYPPNEILIVELSPDKLVVNYVP